MTHVLVRAAIPPNSRAINFDGRRASKMHIDHPMGEHRSDGAQTLEVAEALSGGTIVINHGFNGFGSDFIGCRGV